MELRGLLPSQVAELTPNETTDQASQQARTSEEAPAALKKQPLINKNHYKVHIGRSHSLTITIDPRGTSSVCAVCNADGEETKVKENDDRTIQCPTHGRMNRDTNASLNIAMEGLRVFTWHYKAITSMWLENLKAIKARGLGEGAPEGPGGGALTPRPQ